MSCCSISKPTNISVVDLKKHFDEVIIEEFSKYNLLTLQNKANKANYDYVIWLQVKIAFKDTNGCSHSTQSKLEGAIKSISQWIDTLVNFENSNTGMQLSLFEEEDQNELEVEPQYPSAGDDKNYAKYSREIERVRKSNLKKQYNFFELVDINGTWWHYDDTDFIKFLPQSNEEMIELAKQFILGTAPKDLVTNFFEDEYNYITRSGSLSDNELISRVVSQLDMDLVAYNAPFRVSVDNSYSSHAIDAHISSRFYTRRGEVCGSSWNNQNLPKYDFKNPDFILWLREHFNVSFIEPISDDDILKGNIEHFINSMLWYGKDEYDWKSKINTFKDWKQFKSNIHSFLKGLGIDSRNGGGSGYSLDGLSGGYDLSKKGSIKITQNLQDRVEMDRLVDGLDRDDWRDNERVIVHDISGDEIYKKAFEFFSEKATLNQITLFDFMAA